MPAGWDQVETRLADSPQPEIRTLVQTLSLTFGSQRAMESLRRTAADANADAGTRRTAIDALVAARDPQLAPLLQKLVADAALRGAAIRQLAAFDSAETPALILAAYPSLNPAERRDALNTLASRAPFARALLTAVGAGKLPKSDLTAELIRQLKNLKNPDLDRQLAEVWGVVRETSPDMAKEIQRYKALYSKGGSTPGDAPRGRVVFNQVCAQCHHLFDSGGQVGPDITGANRSDLDYLLQNILYPNAVIPNEYRQSLIETKDGRLVSGIVKTQEGGTLVVQTANELVRVPLSDIAKREQAENSMMPEGLIAQLEEQQVRDLLYYLSRPGQVALPK
jgi:putative heme-binding domain-containing protein